MNIRYAVSLSRDLNFTQKPPKFTSELKKNRSPELIEKISKVDPKYGIDKKTLYGDLSCDHRPSSRQSSYYDTYAIIPDISRNLKFAELSIEELLTFIHTGHTWTPVVYDENKRNNQNFKSQTIFAVDVDSGLTVAETMNILRKYNLPPVHIYPSFSHTHLNPKFRVMFILDQEITDSRISRGIQAMLIYLLGGDPQTKDQARMYFGTCFDIDHFDLDLSHDSRINMVFLFAATYRSFFDSTISRDNDISRVNARFEKFVASTVGFTITGIFDNCDIQNLRKKGDLYIYLYRGHGKNAQSERPLYELNFVEKSLLKNNSKAVNRPSSGLSSGPTTIKDYNDQKKNILISECQLIKDYLEGNFHFSYGQSYHVIYNMSCVEGGEKWIRKTETYKTDDSESEQIIQGRKRYLYENPTSCDHKCPYFSDCTTRPGKNPLSFLLGDKFRMEKIKAVSGGKELNEMRTHLTNRISKYLISENNEYYMNVIKCDTGVGKTEALLQNELRNIVVAFPTHNLKEEAYDRYLKMHPDSPKPFLWPRRPTLPSTYESRMIKIQECGMSGTLSLLQDCLDDSKIQINDKDRIAIHQYLQAIKNIHKSDTIFCTHDKAFQISHIPKIVFDEDLMNTMIKVKSIYFMKEVRQIAKFLLQHDMNSLESRMGIYLESVLKLSDHDVKKNDFELSVGHEKKFYSIIWNLTNKYSVNVVDIFQCDYIQKFENRLSYLIKKKIPQKNILVMSATADEFIYQNIFGDKLNFHDDSGAEKKGKLFIHPEHSYSLTSIESRKKNNLKKYIDVYKNMISRYNLEGIIVRQSEERMLREHDIPVIGHFGALEGLDSMGGKNIGIFGTPHPPEEVYYLWGAMLGWDLNTYPLDFKLRIVERHEWFFKFFTASEQKAWQNLQFYFIESQLQQAVGRARLVNHDCEVHLFSKCPLPGGILTS